VSELWPALVDALDRRGLRLSGDEALRVRLVLTRFGVDLDAVLHDQALPPPLTQASLAHLLLPVLARDAAQAERVRQAIADLAAQRRAWAPLELPPARPRVRAPRPRPWALLAAALVLLTLGTQRPEPPPTAEPPPPVETPTTTPVDEPPVEPPAAPPGLDGRMTAPVPELVVTWLPPQQRPDRLLLAALLCAALLLGLRRMADLGLLPPAPPPPIGARAPTPHPPPPRLPRPVLLPVADRAALVAGVGRFFDADPSTRLDAPRTIDATARAGGRPELRFQGARRDQTVHLWLDPAADDPLLPRLADELAATLRSAGLPVRQLLWEADTDLLLAPERRRVPWSELTDQRGQLRVAALTDGRSIVANWSGPEHDTLTRGLRRLAELGGIIICEPDKHLDPLLAELRLPRVSHADAARALADPDQAGRATPAEAHDPPRLWAALIALSPIPVPEEQAILLGELIGLRAADLPDVRALLGDDGPLLGADREACVDALLHLDLIDWNPERGPPRPLPPTLERARQHLRAWLDAERAHGARSDPAWAARLDGARYRLWLALLDLWTLSPTLALHTLHTLYRQGEADPQTDLAGEVREAVRRLVPADHPRGGRVLRLPWRRDALGAEAQWMAGCIGLGADVPYAWPDVLAPPERRQAGRFVLLGAVAALAVGAWPRWPAVTEDGFVLEGTGPGAIEVGTTLTPSSPRRAGNTDLEIQPRPSRSVWVRAIAGLTETPATPIPTSLLRTPKLQLRSAPRDLPCEEPYAEGVTLLRCPSDEQPRERPADRPRLASALLLDVPDEATGRRWARLLLDGGSVDEVWITAGALAVPCAEARCYAPDIPTPLASGEAVATVALSFSDREPALPGVGTLLFAAGVSPEAALGWMEPRPLVELFPAEAALRVAERPFLLYPANGSPTPTIRAKPLDPAGEPEPLDLTERGIAVRAAALRPDGWKDPEVWATVPAGTWEVGSSDAEAYREEKPVWKVSLPEYKVLRVEVTNAWYRAAKNRPDFEADEPPSWPATDITWDQAEAFCAAIDATLPTEAEWEVAARAGTRGAYSFDGGEAALGDHAWFDGNSGTAPNKGWRTHPVALKRPNPWGLYDIHGNAWEWTASCYGRGGYKPQADAAGVSKDFTTLPISSSGNHPDCLRSVRGGSAWGRLWILRSGCRSGWKPRELDVSQGFRCVRTPTRRQPG
jgi:formylglycine-generating enzyme required for sulfatase activity